MAQDAPHPLLTGQRHDLLVAVAVVRVGQLHRFAVETQQAAARERDAVAIAPQVVHHRLGAAETGFGVDHPVFSHQGLEDPVHRRRLVPQAGGLPGLEGAAQPADEAATAVP